MNKSFTQEDFDAHIKQDHAVSPLSTYLKEIVYGGVDGIVTTFAVVAGFSGSQSGSVIPSISVMVVLLFGLANLFADAVSMGLGNVLSVRADQDVYRKHKRKEKSEIEKNPEKEISETVFILKSKGFSQNDAEKLAAIYSTNPAYWLDFMMRNELEMESPEGENPILTGIFTILAFMFFGSIPLLPYIFLGNIQNIFLISSTSTLVALILLGLLRLRVTHESLVRSVGEIVVLGGVSATIAFFIGTLFR